MSLKTGGLGFVPVVIDTLRRMFKVIRGPEFLVNIASKAAPAIQLNVMEVCGPERNRLA